MAAPFCTRLLADLGADVIKIEPRTGDPVRQWGTSIDGQSLWWSMHGRNKRSVTLNLKTEEARATLLKLVSHCDVVVENFRPGHLAAMQLGDEVLRSSRRDLVIAHISGFGQTGPYRERLAFGVIGEALGGLRYLTNHPQNSTGLPPVRVGVSIGDSIAGLYAAFGVMAALWRKDGGSGDGPGRTVDVALTESVLSMMEGMLPEFGALGLVKQPTGGAIATSAPSNAYGTRDGEWILIAANSDPLFAKLAILMGRPDLIDAPGFRGNRNRVANAAALDDIIGEWTRRHDLDSLTHVLEMENIPNSKVYTASDCASDPQYLDRGMVREVEDACLQRKILHAGVVPHMVEDPGAIRWAGPAIGQHTDEVLSTIAGLQAEEIVELRARGVI